MALAAGVAVNEEYEMNQEDEDLPDYNEPLGELDWFQISWVGFVVFIVICLAVGV